MKPGIIFRLPVKIQFINIFARSIHFFAAIVIFIFCSLVSKAQHAAYGNGPLFIDNKSTVNAPPPVVTNFGVMTLKPQDIDGRLTAANNLGVKYVRETLLLTNWNGTNSSYIDFWLLHDKKIVLNINNDSTPSPFPKNLVTYESKLRAVLDVYGSKIELAVIENEELNKYDAGNNVSTLYHFGSMQDYINELTVAVNVCVEKGVPITNGGLTTPIVSSLMHYYKVSGKQDSVLWLSQQMNGVSADSSLWLRTDSLLTAYKNLPLSYVNLHWYEPLKGMTRATGVLRVLCNYITQQTGKKVMTNESGVKTADSSFVTPLMKQWDSANVKYCIFFDGAGAFGAFPFTSSSNALLPTGIAFRNYNFGATTSCLPTISITPLLPVNLCQGDTTTLMASAGFSNYLWSNGATARSIVVNTPGNYSVTSNQGNCITFSLNTAVVNVNPLPAKPTITTSGSTSNVCPGKPVKLTASPSPIYLWNTGEITKIITADKTGSYKVTVTDVNGCQKTSDLTTVTYHSCIAPINLKVTAITTTKATLNWDTADCAIGYRFAYRIKGAIQWTVVEINGGSTAFRNLFNLVPATTYQWKILTRCKAIPDAVESNYATGPEFTTLAKNFLTAKTIHTDEGNSNTFDASIFPNPVINTATVTVNSIGNELKIVLMDLNGKVFWQREKITDNNINIPVQNLASGLYILIVKNKQYSKILKFVKE